MATAQTAADKLASLDQQIQALQAQKLALNQERIHEIKLKISDQHKALRELEEELETLTGKSSAGPKVRRERRPSIADEHLQPQLLKVLANDGKEGMNAKQLAEKVHQDALRIRKFIKDNPKVLKRTGGGPGTKFFLP